MVAFIDKCGIIVSMTIDRYLTKKVDLSTLANKNIFITGGNSGIGFELAKILVKSNANVFLLCRNLEKADIAKNGLLKIKENANVTIIQLDLASFNSIKQAVEEIKKIDVDVFVNNAGVYRLPKALTEDGIEIIMGTNYIGTLLLNDLLIPYFSSLPHDVKVVLQSSIASKLFKFNMNDFFMEKRYKSLSIYGKSKLGINSIFYTYKEEVGSNISLSLVHPGAAYTPLIKKGYRNRLFEKAASRFMKIFFHSPQKASLSMLNGILSKEKISTYGPRGFLGLSGFPHKWNVKKPKNCEKAIALARTIIKEKGSNNE